jgi:hypothetical protein
MRKASQKSCGQECVDWAIGLLQNGKEGEHLLRLACQFPPHNHFQIARYRDLVLEEQHYNEIQRDQVILIHAREILEFGLEGRIPLLNAVKEVARVCMENNDNRSLFDFRMLNWALDDFQYDTVTHYWPDATPENIMEIIRKRSREFIASIEPLK